MEDTIYGFDESDSEASDLTFIITLLKKAANEYDKTGKKYWKDKEIYWSNQLIQSLKDHVNPNTKLVLEFSVRGERRFITMSPRGVDKFARKLLKGFEETREYSTGSDAIDDFDIYDVYDIELKELPIIKKRNNDGFYFKYYNLSKYDLSKYQIYTKDQLEHFKTKDISKNKTTPIEWYTLSTKEQTLDKDTEITELYEKRILEANEHCLWFAFNQSKLFTEDELISLKLMLKKGNVSRVELKRIAEHFNIQINLSHYIPGNKKVSIPIINQNPNRKILYLSLFKDHYFYNEKGIKIREWQSKNCCNPKFCNNPKFEEIETYTANRYKWLTGNKLLNKYNSEIRAIEIIKNMFNGNCFEEFKFEDHYKDADFESSYKSGIKIVKDDLIYNEISLNDLYEEKKANNKIIFADTETTSFITNEDRHNFHNKEGIMKNTDIHKAFIICWIEIDLKDLKSKKIEELITIEKIKCEYGLDCIKRWLEKIKSDSYIYFHNLKFDWQQIFNRVKILWGLERNKQIYNMSANFSSWNYNTQQNIKKNFLFKDSFKIISNPLRDFPKMFNLETYKDVMPYDLYTQENIRHYDCSIEEAKKYLKKEDHDQFENNLIENRLIHNNGNFDHISYAIHYCKKDVKVLAEGFLKFREGLLNDLGLDAFAYNSISSMADDYLIKMGCYDNIWPLQGSVRAFVQQSVIGGRVCTKNNKKQYIKDEIQDFDAVALYPSSMNRIPGFPKGIPKQITNESINDILEKDYYCIEIIITDQEIVNYDIPIMSYYSNNKRIWSNNLLEKQIVADKLTLEEYIKYYKIKFDIIQGVYWNEGFNNKVNKCIKYLFDQRLKYKEEGNPIQNSYKLLMNSAYGKTITKESTEKIVYKYNTKKNPIEIDDYYCKNYNLIKGGVYVDHEFMQCKKFYIYQNPFFHENYSHCGSIILSMSKIIMNEVVSISYINNIPIFYTDTDSMHLLERDVEILSEKFKKEYSRELVGKNMGQFHCDFNSNIIKKNIKSNIGIFLGKKSYYDKLEGLDENDKIVYDDHIRLKGITVGSIKYKADELGITVQEIFEKLYNEEELEFDLVKGGVKMQYINGGIVNRREFIRKLRFKDSD